MLQVGDCVVSAANGICKIKEETWQTFSSEKRQYFVLVPLDEKGAKLYIPVDTADQRIRRVMTKDEANELLESISSLQCMQIENEKFCEKEYKTAVHVLYAELAYALGCSEDEVEGRIDYGTRISIELS